MSKGERTRQYVIEKAASLFNQRGYEATSISDVMTATGLQKGGVYRHFDTKDELALAAFDYAVGILRERFVAAFRDLDSPVQKLHAIIQVYERIPVDPPVPGGCPMMNAAIEADDTNPALRQRAAGVMDDLRRVIRRTVREGQQRGELDAQASPDAVAVVLICTLEGAVMMSKLYGNQNPMRIAVRHMEQYVASMTR